jgi:hypothetical protein
VPEMQRPKYGATIAPKEISRAAVKATSTDK